MTDGLGVPRTLTWKGRSNTAPETPAGLARAAMPNDAASATTYSQTPESIGAS